MTWALRTRRSRSPSPSTPTTPSHSTTSGCVAAPSACARSARVCPTLTPPLPLSCACIAPQVLELRKGNVDQARSNFQTAQSLASYMFEPFFNGALLAYKLGDFQDSFELCQKSLEAFPDYADSKELIKQLRNHFTML